jgi:hypothetical protein
LRRAGECAVVSVHKARANGLFWLIDDVEILSLSDSCRWIDDSDVDTGNPSALAEKARASGVSQAETLVVNGRYEHVNFIHRPRPLVIHVFDLSPPEPPRLLDMTRQVVAYNDFPAVVLTPHIQSIPELVRDVDDKPILFPCGVSQLKRHANAFYLDERPPRRDWVLVGCDKSRMIHRHLYGDDCSCIELCPKKLFSVNVFPALMRCCMVEQRFELSGRVVVVPWGAERSLIEHACQALLETGDLADLQPHRYAEDRR